MNEERCDHASVSMGNKMFVIGGYGKSTCEIFDSYSRKFCCLKTCSDFINNMFNFQALCVSNRIIIVGIVRVEHQTKMFTYNCKTSEWKFIDSGVLQNKTGFSCVRYHD